MNRKIMSVILSITVFAFMITANLSWAGNLPKTPINQILEHKNGLQLSEAQIKNLNRVNSGIINKMLQIKSRAQIHKAEIEKHSTNWADMDTPKFKSAVKDYYNCLADLKKLEFDALVKAGKILSKEQIKQFQELISIELTMLSLNNNRTGAF